MTRSKDFQGLQLFFQGFLGQLNSLTQVFFKRRALQDALCAPRVPLAFD
jgi:hypothetical protein